MTGGAEQPGSPTRANRAATAAAFVRVESKVSPPSSGSRGSGGVGRLQRQSRFIIGPERPPGTRSRLRGGRMVGRARQPLRGTKDSQAAPTKTQVRGAAKRVPRRSTARKATPARGQAMSARCRTERAAGAHERSRRAARRSCPAWQNEHKARRRRAWRPDRRASLHAAAAPPAADRAPLAAIRRDGSRRRAAGAVAVHRFPRLEANGSNNNTVPARDRPAPHSDRRTRSLTAARDRRAQRSRPSRCRRAACSSERSPEFAGRHVPSGSSERGSVKDHLLVSYWHQAANQEGRGGAFLESASIMNGWIQWRGRGRRPGTARSARARGHVPFSRASVCESAPLCRRRGAAPVICAWRHAGTRIASANGSPFAIDSPTRGNKPCDGSHHSG